MVFLPGKALQLIVVSVICASSLMVVASPPAVTWSDDLAPVVPASALTVVDESPAVNLPSICTRLVEPGWQTHVDLLHYKPRIRGLDYAALDYGNALAIGTGAVQRMDYADDVGIRAGLMYRTKTGWGVGVQGTSIDFSGFDSVQRPQGAGQLFATRVHPDSNQEADTATAQGALEFRYVDLMATRTISSNRFGSFDTFGGFRWADINQSLAFDYDGRDFLQGHLQQDQSTHAFGLRMGASSVWKWANGFGLNGSVAGSLLHGRFDTHATETNLFGNQLMAEMSDDYDDLISVLEVSLGASWECRWFAVTAAYELGGWFNANNRGLFVDDQHEGVIAPFSNDILLQGYSIRLTSWF
ncbi:MAG: hypothetical protein KDB23_15120 [Planctomycetales bacterium]|nr:hypothetical protein [Planctomycetales bacterium]